jgi:hypothetical protein
VANNRKRRLHQHMNLWAADTDLPGEPLAFALIEH